MKVLITGVTGFIGRRLEKFIDPADEIYALCLPSLGSLGSGVKVVLGDLADLSSFSARLAEINPDVCIHLAWQGLPDYGFEASRKNLEQGTALFRFLAEECGCCRIVALGSCWEYGKSLGSCREDDTVATSSYFVWAKHALCDMGLMLAAKYQLSFVWMRLFYVYGPGQRSESLIPTLIRSLKQGDLPVVKTPANANDFVFVDDAAKALLLAAKKDVLTGIYNVGTGWACPVWKVCEILERSMGRKPEYAQQLRASTAAPTAEFWADMSKTEKILGWRAGVSLEQGLQECIHSWGGER
ncbi:MAG: NAD(P)-dependent oxidoreductase [Verrucomicrobia bacterium]|nr:NAD(P)-dependent oxidoreductase [Verrucomicrobiota bacterium]MBU4428254.1 NAD(P)-dependent oxidoreductase [Verrucomicrobiota bacterium]MCG2679553.1 NAD(P)-dependent oxidoreductase [Kiritimatiellia bacterium]